MPVLMHAVSVADGAHSVDLLYVNTTEQLLLAIPTHGAAAARESYMLFSSCSGYIDRRA